MHCIGNPLEPPWLLVLGHLVASAFRRKEAIVQFRLLYCRNISQVNVNCNRCKNLFLMLNLQRLEPYQIVIRQITRLGLRLHHRHSNVFLQFALQQDKAGTWNICYLLIFASLVFRIHSGELVIYFSSVLPNCC